MEQVDFPGQILPKKKLSPKWSLTLKKNMCYYFLIINLPKYQFHLNRDKELKIDRREHELPPVLRYHFYKTIVSFRLTFIADLFLISLEILTSQTK